MSLEKEFERRARFEAGLVEALQAIHRELAAIRALVEGGQPVPPLRDSKPTSDRDYWPGKDIGLTRELSEIVYRDRQSSESSEPESDKAESSETDAPAAMFLKSNLDVPK